MFLKSWIEMGGFELNHHWHGINVLSVLECCLLAALLCAMVGLLARRVRQSRRLRLAAVIGSLFFATAAYAANTALSALSASGALAGANLIYVVQTVGVGGVKATMTQVVTFINSLFSGDATVSSGGTVTFATVNGNVGSFGSSTQCVTVTVNAKGLVTAASAASCAPPFTAVTGRATLAQLPQGIANSIWVNPTGSTADMTNVAVPACANDGAHGLVYVNGTGLQCASITQPAGANPSATAGPTANNGSASTFMRSDASPAVQAASNAQKGLVQCDGTTIVCPSGTATAVPGVTSRTVTSSPDTILAGDRGNVVYYNSASAIAITQPAPSGSFAAGFFTTLCNINSGLPTVTPGSGTIGGAGTFALPIVGTAANPACASYQSDGTNFNLVPDYVVNAALFTAGTLADARLSSNVPLKNGTNVFTGANTFAEVIGGGRTVSGTTDTLAATDCGTTVVYSNAGAVTVTVPQGLPTVCVIALMQTGAGKVSTNGSAVTPATQHASGAFTGTRAQYSVINITNYTTNTVVLSGDAS